MAAVGRCEPDTRALGDTAFVTTGSTAPADAAAAGQAAIIVTTPGTVVVVGEGDHGSLIEH
jgi:hypothetical protein